MQARTGEREGGVWSWTCSKNLEGSLRTASAKALRPWLCLKQSRMPGVPEQHEQGKESQKWGQRVLRAGWGGPLWSPLPVTLGNRWSLLRVLLDLICTLKRSFSEVKDYGFLMMALPLLTAPLREVLILVCVYRCVCVQVCVHFKKISCRGKWLGLEARRQVQ